ncbi:hypothetical protein Bbelb_437520 [Branchiostoma belcheri]|nr:hypothetical protein Bbelb_437520 [Branchiostoma belcheri]
MNERQQTRSYRRARASMSKHHVQDRTCQLCGGTLTGSGGEVTSHGFPNFYLHNQDCTWVIEARGGRASVTFLDFELEQPAGGAFGTCRYDYVEILSSGESLGTYCGNMNPGSASSDDRIEVRFVSDATFDARGFRFTYKVQGAIEEPSCGGILNDTSGVVTSPGYPGEYDNFLDCTWTLPATGVPVTVTFTDFQTETSFTGLTTCLYDWVDMYEDGTQLGRWCGTEKPDDVTSTKSLRIRFRSDGSVGDRGFRFVYEYRQPDETTTASPSKLPELEPTQIPSEETTSKVSLGAVAVLSEKYPNVSFCAAVHHWANTGLRPAEITDTYQRGS